MGFAVLEMCQVLVLELISPEIVIQYSLFQFIIIKYEHRSPNNVKRIIKIKQNLINFFTVFHEKSCFIPVILPELIAYIQWDPYNCPCWN